MKANGRATALAVGIGFLLPGCDYLWNRPSTVTVAVDKPAPAPPPQPSPPPPPDPEPPSPPRPVIQKLPTAMAVPGKEGFVFSPFNNKLIDVKGFASGTLVADPHYPASERKHFRVP